MIPVQGPNSSQVKFKHSICHNCNTTRSKPFDEAYDKFNTYIKENEEIIFAERKFYFSNIFLQDWKTMRMNLIKYYIKHICSRLVEANLEIKPDIIEYLNGISILKSISFKLIIRGDIMFWINKMKANSGIGGYINMEPLKGKFLKKENAFDFLTGTLDYRAFTLKYFYSLNNQNQMTNFENYMVTPDYYANQEAIRFIEKNYKRN